MSNNDKLREYQAFSQMIKKTMLMAGLWPVSEPGFFYRALPFLNLFFCAAMSLFIFNFVRLHLNNINVMTKGMSAGASFMTTMLKIMSITFNRKNLVELHGTLDNIFKELLEQTDIQHLVLKKITRIRRMSTFLVFLVLASIVSYIVIPIIFIVHQHIHHVEPVKYILVFPTVYPWKITGGSLLYQLHFVFHAYTAGVLFFVTSGIDALFPFYIFQMTGQLHALSHSLTNLRDHNDCDKAVRECVSKYQALMRCRDIIQLIYGPIILWMLLTSAIILCALTFQMSKLDSISVGHVCLFIAYSGSKLLQAFLYGEAGTMLTSQSEAFQEAIYASSWERTGLKRFRTSILIMLTQKPLMITACNYSIVSVDMFAMILNTTVSYFFLLTTMDAKQA